MVERVELLLVDMVKGLWIDLVVRGFESVRY